MIFFRYSGLLSPTVFSSSLKPSIIETIPLLRRSKPKVWIEAYGYSASIPYGEICKVGYKGNSKVPRISDASLLTQKCTFIIHTA
jgi:hypothetical protein